LLEETELSKSCVFPEPEKISEKEQTFFTLEIEGTSWPSLKNMTGFLKNPTRSSGKIS
jgi:hypothetical protein